MTRSMLSLLAVGVALGIFTGPGCKATGIGDPCTPEQEFDPNFAGFNVNEVNVESKSFQCQTRLCLVNHFQGRVSCTYGQVEKGGKCVIPGGTQGTDGDDVVPAVSPQCTDRTAGKTVYCSCRCADINGRTDDGAIYCGCPDGFSCTQLVTSIGQGEEGLTGRYCIKVGTEFNTAKGNCSKTCSPDTTDTKCP